jgi:hypothetical protein
MVVVARDVEAAQTGRQQECGEVVGGQRRDHRQTRESAAEREHGFDSLAGGDDIACRAETDAIAKYVAHRPARGDRRLPAPSCASQVRCTPVIVPSWRSVAARAAPATPHGGAVIGTVEAPRMEAQRHKARPEQVILFSVSAWDVNCPQHIPHRFEAADVAAALAERDRRISELEAEVERLRQGARDKT